MNGPAGGKKGCVAKTSPLGSADVFVKMRAGKRSVPVGGRTNDLFVAPDMRYRRHFQAMSRAAVESTDPEASV